jgi:Cytochrome c oxidase subunit IV
MKSFVGLFLIAAGFGLTIAIAYFFIAKEEAAGTALLTIMTVALVFTAGYAILAERDADLVGDQPQETPDEAAGEDLGVFTTQSVWPILIALSVLATLIGTLWSPLLLVIGFVAFCLCLWRMGAESARA